MTLGAVGVGGYAAYGYLKNKEDEPISNEPFAAGNLDITKDYGSVTPGVTSFGNPTGANPDAQYIEEGYVPKELTIPLDSGEFKSKIDPSIQKIILESPLTYISDGGLVFDAIQKLVVNRSTAEGSTQEVVYVDAFTGKQYNSEQAILDEFIKQSVTPELLRDISEGTALSTLQAIQAGQPINVTNVITKRPEFFPEAKFDAISEAFQSRARALAATLTVTNPGGSSAAGLPNFSRLAALGTDLSQVDLYSVRNPDFLGEIKSGQGPLTTAQKILVDQARLTIDSRNMTSSDRAQIEANTKKRQAEIVATALRSAQLIKAGYNEANAKAALLKQGINVTGSLSASQYAALEKRLGSAISNVCLSCKSTKIKPTVNPGASNLAACYNTGRINFLRQTKRKDFYKLSAKETALWNLLTSRCK
jgi:hypothetical protein